jgi:hypothetical protein
VCACVPALLCVDVCRCLRFAVHVSYKNNEPNEFNATFAGEYEDLRAGRPQFVLQLRCGVASLLLPVKHARAFQISLSLADLFPDIVYFAEFSSFIVVICYILYGRCFGIQHPLLSGSSNTFEPARHNDSLILITSLKLGELPAVFGSGRAPHSHHGCDRDLDVVCAREAATDCGIS